MQKINEIGNRHGRLLVIREARPSSKGQSRWLCICDCGNEKEVLGTNLRNSLVVSCGCFRKETTGTLRRSHGLSRTLTYRSWRMMWRRCTDPNQRWYELYGGRGITVCERWKDVSNFVEDMGYRPSIKHTLDRKDNNLGYYPGNCRWATPKEQSSNRRNTLYAAKDGVTRTLREWSDILGIPYPTLQRRKQEGRPDDQVLSTRPLPNRGNRKK